MEVAERTSATTDSANFRQDEGGVGVSGGKNKDG